MARAGSYNELIQIKSKTRAKDDFGQGIETKTIWKEIWADVQPLSGYEKRIAGKLTPEQTQVITIRRDDEVTADDEVKWGDRVLRIERVERIRERHETRLLCRETKVITERAT